MDKRDEAKLRVELERVTRELNDLKSRMYREIALYGRITENIKTDSKQGGSNAIKHV